MRCSRCTNEATVFYKQIVGNKLREEHLCASCAREAEVPIASPLEALLNALGQKPALRPPKPLACSQCGLRYSQFREVGRLGCSQCYESFRAPLAEVMLDIHNADTHCGKRPGECE